jgi:hypothetical protein
MVYVWLTYKLGSRSWTPILASILVDILAKQLAAKDKDLSPAQREQWSIRKKLYMMYFFRGPLFTNVTLLPLHIAMVRLVSILNTKHVHDPTSSHLSPQHYLENVPVLGSVLSMVDTIASIVKQHYFYTSAS